MNRNSSILPLLRKVVPLNLCKLCNTRPAVNKGLCQTDYSNEFQKNNREKVNSSRRPYFASLRASDPQYAPKKRIACSTAVAVRKAVDGNATDNFLKYVGTTSRKLIAHLETQFQPGMTFANYGTVWEVDHIQPLSTFDLTCEYQAALAGHFSNLRPLFVRMNRTQRKAA